MTWDDVIRNNHLNTSYGMFGQYEPDIMKYIENDIKITRDADEKIKEDYYMPTKDEFPIQHKLYWTPTGPSSIGKITNPTTNNSLKIEYDPKAWMKPKKVIFNDPATIVFWNDESKTVVKCENEDFDPEKGFAMAFMKHVLGNKGNYYNVVKDAIKDYEPIDVNVSVADEIKNITSTFTKLCDLWK